MKNNKIESQDSVKEREKLDSSNIVGVPRGSAEPLEDGGEYTKEQEEIIRKTLAEIPKVHSEHLQNLQKKEILDINDVLYLAGVGENTPIGEKIEALNKLDLETPERGGTDLENKVRIIIERLREGGTVDKKKLEEEIYWTKQSIEPMKAGAGSVSAVESQTDATVEPEPQVLGKEEGVQEPDSRPIEAIEDAQKVTKDSISEDAQGELEKNPDVKKTEEKLRRAVEKATAILNDLEKDTINMDSLKSHLDEADRKKLLTEGLTPKRIEYLKNQCRAIVALAQERMVNVEKIDPENKEELGRLSKKIRKSEIKSKMDAMETGKKTDMGEIETSDGLQTDSDNNSVGVDMGESGVTKPNVKSESESVNEASDKAQKAEGFSQETRDLADSDKTLEEIFEERAKAKELKDAKKSADKLYEEGQSGVTPESESKSANEQNEKKALLDRWVAVELERIKQKERGEVREKCWEYILDPKIKNELCKEDGVTRDEDKFTAYLNDKIKEFAVPPSTGRTNFSSRTRFEIRSMPNPSTQKPNFSEEAFNMRILEGYRVDDIRRRGFQDKFWDSANWMRSGVTISQEMEDGFDHDFYSFKDLENFKRESLELAMKREEKLIKILKEKFAKKKAGSAPEPAQKRKSKIESENLSQEAKQAAEESRDLIWGTDLVEIGKKQTSLSEKIKTLELAEQGEDSRKYLVKELKGIFKFVDQMSRNVKQGLTKRETAKAMIEEKLLALEAFYEYVKKKYSKTKIEPRNRNNENEKPKTRPGKDKSSETSETPRHLNVFQVLEEKKKLGALTDKKKLDNKKQP